jgi:hypothetical protein
MSENPWLQAVAGQETRLATATQIAVLTVALLDMTRQRSFSIMWP